MGMFMLELLICSVTAVPNVNVVIEGRMVGGDYAYHLSDLFLIIMLLRCYLILRLYEHYSKWTTYKAHVLCKKYGTSVMRFSR